MEGLLDAPLEARARDFLDFTAEHVAPAAHGWEQAQAISEAFITAAGRAGYLGLRAPTQLGGMGAGYTEFGLFNRAVGRHSVSATGLFNVHSMVIESLLRWGTEEQQRRWVPALARGERIGALALTEPGAGSDIAAIAASYTEVADGYVLNGVKRWITLGARADLLLVFAKLDGQPTACLVDRRESPGLEVTPIRDMLGFKAAHLAELRFEDVRVPRANLLGRPGFAFSFIAPYALDLGRLSIMFTALGMIEACLQLAGGHALRREAFGARLIDHMTVSRMIAQMGIDLRAGSLLALTAADARARRLPESTEHIMAAKYFLANAAATHAANAVQILGARGCNEECPAARHYRDARTLQIIEGSNEIHEMILGKHYARHHAG